MRYVNESLRKKGDSEVVYPHGEISTYYCKVGLWDTDFQYEFYEMHFTSKDMKVGNHLHHKGIESFYMIKGSAEVIMNGHRFIMKAGDLAHVPAQIPHEFVFLDEDVLWVSVFQNVDQFKTEGNKMLRGDYNLYGEIESNPQLRQDIATYTDTHFFVKEPIIKDNDDYHYFRKKGVDVGRFVDDEGTHSLKVPMWECNGKTTEVWVTELEKGQIIGKHRHHFRYETLYILSGAVEFDNGIDQYTATVGDTIHITPFMPHALLCLEKNTSYLYVSCCTQPNSKSLMQVKAEEVALRNNSPESFKDPSFLKEREVDKDHYLLDD